MKKLVLNLIVGATTVAVYIVLMMITAIIGEIVWGWLVIAQGGRWDIHQGLDIYIYIIRCFIIFFALFAFCVIGYTVRDLWNKRNKELLRNSANGG